jgi:hypothetical protein
VFDPLGFELLWAATGYGHALGSAANGVFSFHLLVYAKGCNDCRDEEVLDSFFYKLCEASVKFPIKDAYVQLCTAQIQVAQEL